MKKRHPRNFDRFRHFLASHSILYFLLVYVLATTCVAIALSAAVLVSAGAFFESSANDWYALFKPFFTLIYGIDAAYAEIPATPITDACVYAAALFSVAAPALLFGAIVFKVLLPRKPLLVFRDKLGLDLTKSELVSSFYISTALPVFKLQWTVNIQYFRRDDKTRTHSRSFPLINKQLDDGSGRGPLSAPLSFMPLKFWIPVTIAGPDVKDTFNEGAESHCIAFEVEDRAIKSIYLDGDLIDAGEGEFCDIQIIVEGYIPQVQGGIFEVKHYDLLNDITLDLDPGFDLARDRERRKFVVEWRETY